MVTIDAELLGETEKAVLLFDGRRATSSVENKAAHCYGQSLIELRSKAFSARWGSAMPDDPDKIYSNTVVTIDLKGECHQLGPDLDQKELAAIGWVTAHWAILEHYLLHQTVEMAKARSAEPNQDAFNLSFARRFKAWLSEVRLLSAGDRKTQLEKLSGKIARCEDVRHKTTHGLWAWDMADPDQLTAFSNRPRVAFEISVDADGLIKLAQEIGEVNFVLAYPNGKEDFYAEKAAEGSSFSRSFIKAIRPDKPHGE